VVAGVYVLDVFRRCGWGSGHGGQR
jgi:hypothetical protein